MPFLLGTYCTLMENKVLWVLTDSWRFTRPSPSVCSDSMNEIQFDLNVPCNFRLSFCLELKFHNPSMSFKLQLICNSRQHNWSPLNKRRKSDNSFYRCRHTRSYFAHSTSFDIVMSIDFSKVAIPSLSKLEQVVDSSGLFLTISIKRSHLYFLD